MQEEIDLTEMSDDEKKFSALKVIFELTQRSEVYEGVVVQFSSPSAPKFEGQFNEDLAA